MIKGSHAPYHLDTLKPEEWALANFEFFIQHYLDIKLWACHKRWARAFQWAVEDDTKEGFLLLAPADHGKTSSIVIPAMLWLHARDRNARIIYAMGKDEHAIQGGMVWRNRIERIPSLRKKFGLAKGGKWTDTEYFLQREDWQSKDPSLQCVGAGSEIQSQRADWEFFDDIATRRNSRAVSQREQLRTWVQTDMRSRLDRTRGGRGKRFFFGHRVDRDDLYSELEKDERFVVIKDKAIINDNTKEILAPEGHDYSELTRQRSDDPIGFSLLYQQEPVSTGVYITRQQLEPCKHRDKIFHDRIPDHIRSQYVRIVMSLDPAFSHSKWAKYAVWQVWGIRFNGVRTLLWGFRERCAPEQLIQISEAKFQVYNPDKFFIEDNTAQSLMMPVLRRKFPAQATNISGVTTVNPKGELDMEIGRMFDSYAAQPPMIELPYGCQASQLFVDQHIEELVNWPNGKYSDSLMSQYIFEKGMGLVKQEQRKGFIPKRGVLGSVAHEVKRAFTTHYNARLRSS